MQTDRQTDRQADKQTRKCRADGQKPDADRQTEN